MSEPVISMQHIVKKYYEGKPNELEILHGIDLTVHQGEFVSIVGESGSGKSTLMNIIGVLDRQTDGMYSLEGQDVGSMSDEIRSAIRNRRIGFVFQNFNLLPRANALKNVMVPLMYSDTREKTRKSAQWRCCGWWIWTDVPTIVPTSSPAVRNSVWQSPAP